MKKTNHHRVWTGLMACLLAVTAWMFYGCSDDDYHYPEGAVLPKGELAKPFQATRLKGVLRFDDEEKKWVINPKNVAYPFESTWNYGHNVIYISNMNNQYKSLKGDVVFSGTVKRLYTFAYPNICSTTGYFKIELSELYADDIE